MKKLRRHIGGVFNIAPCPAHGLICVPAGRGRPAGIRFTPAPEQRAVMQQLQASNLLVSGRACAVGCTSARLFDELSGRVPMPEERVAALAYLFAQYACIE